MKKIRSEKFGEGKPIFDIEFINTQTVKNCDESLKSFGLLQKGTYFVYVQNNTPLADSGVNRISLYGAQNTEFKLANEILAQDTQLL